MSLPGYFGHNFGPVCDDRPLVPTPVGEICGQCNEPVQLEDFGLYIPYLDSIDSKSVSQLRPVHAECNLRTVVGGIEHLTAPKGHKPGSCYEGSPLSYRTSARQAWAYIQTGGKA